MKRYCFYIDLLDEDENVIDSTYEHCVIKGQDDDEIYCRATEYFDLKLDLGQARYFTINDFQETV